MKIGTTTDLKSRTTLSRARPVHHETHVPRAGENLQAMARLSTTNMMPASGDVHSVSKTHSNCDIVGPVLPAIDILQPNPGMPAVDGGANVSMKPTTGLPPLGTIIEDMRETYRRRLALHQEEKALTLRIKAKERERSVRRNVDEGKDLPRGKFPFVTDADKAYVKDAYLDLYEARAIIEAGRKRHEKRLKALAEQLPAAEWWCGIRGANLLGLGVIVGVAGDLSNYDNPAKVWKRFGLDVWTDGKANRKSKTDAEERGYSPTRRSAMWTIGDCLVKQGEEYRDLYLRRKEYEIDKAEERGLTVVPAAKITAKNRDLHMSQGHVHRRAQRYMEKRLLRDLWSVWRRVGQPIFDNHGNGADPIQQGDHALFDTRHGSVT